MRALIRNLTGIVAITAGTVKATQLELGDVNAFIPTDEMLADTPTAASTNMTALTGEQYSSVHRVGCVAELQGYHFNLKELNLPIDP